jgi:hypothetical protein
MPSIQRIARFYCAAWRSGSRFAILKSTTKLEASMDALSSTPVQIGLVVLLIGLGVWWFKFRQPGY